MQSHLVRVGSRGRGGVAFKLISRLYFFKTQVFTQAPPLASARVRGALVLLHAPFDGNGGGTQVALFTGEPTSRSEDNSGGWPAALGQGTNGRFTVLG
jgi:hypothetical protein